MIRLTDHLDMTLVVNCDVKPQFKPKKLFKSLKFMEDFNE